MPSTTPGRSHGGRPRRPLRRAQNTAPADSTRARRVPRRPTTGRPRRRCRAGHRADRPVRRSPAAARPATATAPAASDSLMRRIVSRTRCHGVHWRRASRRSRVGRGRWPLTTSRGARAPTMSPARVAVEFNHLYRVYVDGRRRRGRRVGPAEAPRDEPQRTAGRRRLGRGPARRRRGPRVDRARAAAPQPLLAQGRPAA